MLLGAGLACGQSNSGAIPRTRVDPALVQEQQRRISAFDSVVRSVNTDSSYKLWHAMLAAPDIRKAQLAMMCENARLSDLYGKAGMQAIRRMLDTLFIRDDPKLVERMERRLVGESPGIGRDTCGDRPGATAPLWLRKWYVPSLPELPPSPDTTVRLP